MIALRLVLVWQAARFGRTGPRWAAKARLRRLLFVKRGTPK